MNLEIVGVEGFIKFFLCMMFILWAVENSGGNKKGGGTRNVNLRDCNRRGYGEYPDYR